MFRRLGRNEMIMKDLIYRGFINKLQYFFFLAYDNETEKGTIEWDILVTNLDAITSLVSLI